MKYLEETSFLLGPILRWTLKNYLESQDTVCLHYFARENIRKRGGEGVCTDAHTIFILYQRKTNVSVWLVINIESYHIYK